jgi:glutathione S-transferase
MIEFYGAPASSSGRTHWLLEEIGVPYSYKRVDTRNGETRSPEFLRMYPSGKVPVLKDGDFVLGESMAIDFYLAEKYQPALLPSDSRERAEIYQWSFWAISNLQPPLLSLMFANFGQSAGEPTPQLQSARRDADHLLGALELALTGNTHLVGGRFTLADLHVASIVNLALVAKLLDAARYANTSNWLERMRVRPAWQRAAKAQ